MRSIRPTALLEPDFFLFGLELRPELLHILEGQCRAFWVSPLSSGAGLTFPAMSSEDSSVAMIAGSYLQRSRVHHSVAIIAW